MAELPDRSPLDPEPACEPHPSARPEPAHPSVRPEPVEGPSTDRTNRLEETQDEQKKPGGSHNPLGRATLSTKGASVTELPRQGLILLRGRESDPFHKSAQAILGHGLPTAPNRVTGVHGNAALWLRPGGWLLRRPLGECASVAAKFTENQAENLVVAIDVSHQYTVINIAGEGARDFLAASCPLNLTPGHFATGHCAGTLFGEITVILQQISDTPGYDLIVDQSLARFTWWWLQELAK